MAQVKCPETGCETVINGKTEKSARNGLAIHLSRAHGIKGTSRNAKWKQKIVEEKPKIQRRSKKHVEPVTINFCPGCGCDIHAVAMGMALAGRMKK